MKALHQSDVYNRTAPLHGELGQSNYAPLAFEFPLAMPCCGGVDGLL